MACAVAYDIVPLQIPHVLIFRENINLLFKSRKPERDMETDDLADKKKRSAGRLRKFQCVEYWSHFNGSSSRPQLPVQKRIRYCKRKRTRSN